MALLTLLGAGAAGATAAGATAAGAAAAAGGAASVGAAGGAIGALGSALSAAGTAAGIYGQFAGVQASKRAEELRERQMNLEAARERRGIVRKAIMARSEAVSNATVQGAQYGSGLQGGLGQIASEQGQGLLAVNQNQEIGRGIFAANRDMAKAETISSFGSGMQSLGGKLVNNMELFGRLGTYYNGS